jgi:Mg-chelatase subunit ChlI
MKKMILSLVTVMTVLGTSVSYGRTVNNNNGKNNVKVESVQKMDNKSDEHKDNTKQVQNCNCSTCVELRKQESKKESKKQTEKVTQKSDKKTTKQSKQTKEDTIYRFGNEQQNTNNDRTVVGVRK